MCARRVTRRLARVRLLLTDSSRVEQTADSAALLYIDFDLRNLYTVLAGMLRMRFWKV